MFVLIDQRDTNGLANENTELKMRLQAMEQQAHLRNGNSKSLYFSYDAFVKCKQKVFFFFC